MAKKHDKPKRVESAQALKATGCSSGQPIFCARSMSVLLMTSPGDTYMEAELMRCARWCLQKFSGRQRVYIGLRDAAMLLFSAASAVRGGSSQILCWSNLFVSYIPMDGVHLGKKVPVSCEGKMGFALSLKLTDADPPPPHRSLLHLQKMQSTTSKAVLMNMGSFDTALSSCALSVQLPGSSSDTSTL